MKPRVYLSASSAELPRARVARDALRELGCAVVGAEWIDAVAAHGEDDAALRRAYQIARRA